MPTEQWSRLEDIFDRALRIPVEQRRGFLDQECRNEEGLRRRVDQLIASDAQAGDFMESPAIHLHPSIAEGAAEDFEDDLPEVFESFEVLEVLGKGGMGAVYLARQIRPIERLVALKSILPNRMSREAILRFQAEQQALARMNHANIAQVFDAGVTADERPYLVMEYVDGMRLTEYCDERKLSISERLELFADVCAGVQHLHQKAVIHRDLKPANILVTETDGRPVAKIIDFGIAKGLGQPLIDETLDTRGMLIGTPSYLSPEAIRAIHGPGDVDTRSDVYSLGILLYELLTGCLPFDARQTTLLEALKTKLESDPARPSAVFANLELEIKQASASARRTDPVTLCRVLALDLDWIVLKAMAPDRDLRYGSAEQLRADVRAHLRGELVAARPPSAGYRIKKFVRLHFVPLAATVAVMAALTLGLFLRTLEAERANHEAARAAREARVAQEVVGLLVEMFNSSDPLHPETNRGLTVRELLDRGERSASWQLGHQPLVQAKLLDTIGTVHCKLGNFAKGTEMIRRALDLRQRHLASGAPELAESLESLAAVLMDQEQFDEAEQLLASAFESRRQGLADDDPQLAESYYLQALLSSDRGDLEHAFELMGRSLELAGSKPDSEEQTATVLEGMGGVLTTQGRFHEVEPVARRALDLRRRVLEPGHPLIGKALQLLGISLFNLLRFEEAEPYLIEALELQEQALGAEHPQVADTLHGLASLYHATKRAVAAEPLERRALAIRQKVYGPSHNNVALSLNSLAEIRRQSGDPEEAEQLFLKAKDVWQEVNGPRHHFVAVGLNNLGNIYLRQQRFDDASAVLEQAIDILNEALGPEHPFTAHPMTGLAEARHRQGDIPAAIELFERALEIWDRADYTHAEAKGAAKALAELKRGQNASLSPSPSPSPSP